MAIEESEEFKAFHECYACHLVNEMSFHRVYTPVPEHWQAECPNCDTKNYIARRDWDEEYDRGDNVPVPA